jgi:hypothetical protein
LTATIVQTTSTQLIAHHWAAGKLVFEMSDIRHIRPQFFGRDIMIEARQFHLGNAIRSDFRRHRPDGVELHFSVRFADVPRGQPSLSFEVAELEAAGPAAPPGSPFLKQLRSGRLLTEVYINDRPVGDLNSLIRFKSNDRNPERVRLAISRDLLKVGDNSIRLVQKALDDSGREFDDCEIGRVRLEFEMIN